MLAYLLGEMMASTWNGSALLTRYTQKFGLTDTTSTARVLEWINEIQEDIATSYRWPFLKMKMKKQFTSAYNEIDCCPQIPTAPSASATSGGSLTADTVYQVKTTFIIYATGDHGSNFVESEPSTAVSVTPTGANLTISLTSLDTYDDGGIRPTNIHRRIYLKKGSNPFYFYADIENNTATTTTITADTSSTIEPPEHTMVQCLADEDPTIEGSGVALIEVKLDDILKFDPGLTSTGTPQYYARTTPTEIFLYPRPSTTITLSYWIYKRPQRIFSDENRVIQLPPQLKTVLDAGVTWKGYEYKDADGQESKLSNYVQLKKDAFGVNVRTGGQARSVRVVC